MFDHYQRQDIVEHFSDFSPPKKMIFINVQLNTFKAGRAPVYTAVLALRLSVCCY